MGWHRERKMTVKDASAKSNSMAPRPETAAAQASNSAFTKRTRAADWSLAGIRSGNEIWNVRIDLIAT